MDSSAFAEAGGWPEVLSKLFRREDLTVEMAASALEEILAGHAEVAQIAAFLAALRTKGESVEEMTGFVAAMRRHGEPVSLGRDAIDTCGTGGDRSGTINVSTAAALICAAAGVAVCKHGNRALSSQAGSADVLEALGVAIELGPRGVERCVEEVGIGFCFAPRYHPAMRHANPVRRELGVATVFNFLGPLANPAAVKRQVVGVGDPQMAERMLGVLEANGALHSIVCYGADGLDELSTTGPSVVLESRLSATGERSRRSYELDAADYGIKRAKSSDLLGGQAAENAHRVRAILSGEAGPQRDIVCWNAAAALYVAGKVEDLGAGLTLVQETVDSGAATEVLRRFVESSLRARSEGLL